MIRQFKLILICVLLLLPGVIAGQDSTLDELDTSIDSLHNVITLELNQQVQEIIYNFRKQINYQNLHIDSLQSEISIQKGAQHKLNAQNEMLARKLASLNQTFQSHQQIIIEEHKRLKRVLLISVPSLLLLIIFSAVLFFILIFKYRDQTDKKISALRRYTHSELEDTRNDLLNKLKKRFKKIKGKRKKGKEKRKKGQVVS